MLSARVQSVPSRLARCNPMILQEFRDTGDLDIASHSDDQIILNVLEFEKPTDNVKLDTTKPEGERKPDVLANGVASTVRVDVEIVREITRTPSPTLSEVEALEKGLFDYKSLKNLRFWTRRNWIKYYIAFLVIFIAVVLVAVFHTKIALAIQPSAGKLRSLRAGWIIPIALLFVLSFPPLFGHEIIAAIAGLVWGVWIGFGIVAAGTYLGEVGNFYAFRWFCRARGEKWERNKINYSCLAKIVREGGIKVATVVRWSVIPGHFSTAVFSTCGMKFWVFSFSAIASIPKHFVPVYVGSTLGVKKKDESVREHIITYTVLAGTVLVTICAFLFIAKRMEGVKRDVIHARRRQRRTESAHAVVPPGTGETCVVPVELCSVQRSLEAA